jgi:uncharacterized damage-inducible protein DinB
MRAAVALAAALLTAARLAAQVPTVRPMPPMARPGDTSGSPIVRSAQGAYDTMKGYLLAAAAEMPSQDYGFRPATLPAADKAEIRTFGQVVGHVAQANFLFCAAAEAQAPPAGTQTIEQTKTTKADLVPALTDSFASCDRAWAGTTDANAAQPGRYPDSLALRPPTRLGALVFNTVHAAEHYGNLVTYLRAKGLVPPSSQPGK